ncbi:MAG: gliding motility-associated C-terminal domain-containing protein [Mucilaginibacter sp.]|uniref:gliding motility-associated C-terminal domain-containing protein n=1 Tax=Mucilaginibacter sp. TaxID=1882438 RepID=UPI0031A9F1DA
MQFKRLLFLLLIFIGFQAYSQDVEFHLNAHLFPGKNILKVKRDFRDPYLWVLARNNEVYRVNSVTLAVDDYTSTFAAYSGLQFIDIAGRSQDTVFIATNSTNVIEYTKGVKKLIGAANGIATAVNSVGIAKNERFGIDADPHSVLIGSDNGLYTYDMVNETVQADNTISSSKIYEATYRDLVYKDSSATYPDWDGRKYVPVLIKGELTRFLYYMAESDIIGHNINTGYLAFGSMYEYDQVVSYTALFWGTRNGMFQVNGDLSYFINLPYEHYLDGINVNKITTIFGLTAFGNGHWDGYPGFLKQNMLIGTDKGLYYSNSIYQKVRGTRNVNLFHFDALGNTVIHDVCVNTVSAGEPVCDDGAWIATTDGLYFIKPDYGKYLTATSINAVQFAGQNPTVSEMQICLGSSITATVNDNIYTGHTIQWYKNGVELPGESNSTLTINADGNYSAIVYDPCENLHLNTNSLKVTVITAPTVNLNYPDKSFYCDGSTATFEVNANANYKYRWYTDGVLNGNTSNSINVTQSGKYKVEVSACSDTWVPSKEIEAEFIKLPALMLKTDKIAYCIGDEATLSIDVPVDAASYTINWLRDGTIINNTTNKTSLTTNIAGNYQVAISSNKITCSESSSLLPLIFNPMPSITLERVVNTTLCSGQAVDLRATFANGTVKWSTGETGSQISVKDPGDYTATVTSASGCVDSRSINVQFFSNPVLSLPDAKLCQFNRQQVTLNAPPGFTKYEWNGKQGGDSFTTGSIGKVELKVTDLNGCTASQTITINSFCTEIKMANTFTPNADGINDTWVIEGIDQSVTVKIYNRLGSLLFNSRGYTEPWDGTYKGSKLPAGTYYYIIKSGTQVLSGWVHIIY